MAASLVFDEKPQRLCLLEQMYLVTEEAYDAGSHQPAFKHPKKLDNF